MGVDWYSWLASTGNLLCMWQVTFAPQRGPQSSEKKPHQPIEVALDYLSSRRNEEPERLL